MRWYQYHSIFFQQYRMKTGWNFIKHLFHKNKITMAWLWKGICTLTRESTFTFWNKKSIPFITGCKECYRQRKRKKRYDFCWQYEFIYSLVSSSCYCYRIFLQQMVSIRIPNSLHWILKPSILLFFLELTELIHSPNSICFIKYKSNFKRHACIHWAM